MICVECIEQEVCICRSICGGNKQTNRVKKHVGRDYSSINTASNTVAGSQESFGKVTSKTNAPHNLFFPSFMIRLENNVLRAESSLTASCVVSYYVYWSLWTDISKPPNVFSLGPRLESLHIDKNQQRSDSRRLTPTTISLSQTHSLGWKFNWKYSGTSSTQGSFFWMRTWHEPPCGKNCE